MPHDALHIWVIANVFGGAAAGDHQCDILRRIHIGETRHPPATYSLSFSVYVSNSSTKSWMTNCSFLAVGAAISTSYPPLWRR